ncbi:MAG: hypothetical protein KDA77_20980, partial [Planctomycetaceae bacterium]|nr:hypothetical protein [Planctomycetaceae bacterium]
GFQYRVCQRSEETQNCLESLYAPPQLTNPDNLEKLIVRLAAAEERTLLDQEAAAILMECVPPPELIDGDRLAQLCQQWETAVALFQELQQIQAESESEYERVRTELIHWVEENPSCPTCGAELEPGQFILIAETGLKGHIHGT